jgi:hypothetical protein
VGFGINTTDMNSTSANHNGIYSLELKLDGQTVYTFTVERFAFDQTHAINAYIDYPAFLSHRAAGCRSVLYCRAAIYPFTRNLLTGVSYF